MGRDFCLNSMKAGDDFCNGTARNFFGRVQQIRTTSREINFKTEEVKSVSRRTGRAEQDEHAEGVHSSEVDVDFKEGGRHRDVVLNEIRSNLSGLRCFC